MKKILIIANLFHASPRIPGIAMHLAEFGWDPVILTVPIDKEDSRNLLGFPSGFNGKVRIIETPYQGDIFWFWRKIFKKLGFNTNRSILNQSKEKIRITSKKSLIDYIFNFYQTIFGYPDDEKNWEKPAVKIGNKLLEKEKFDAVISSSSPVIAHIIASKLNKKLHIPWIADFRDLWTQNHNYSYPWWRKFFERRLELKTLQSANILTTVSPLWAKKLNSLHRDKKTYAITNGFYPEEINTPLAQLEKKFTIIYAGALYVEKQNPEDFFVALKELISEDLINSEEVKVKFYSGNLSWLKKEIKKHELGNIVDVYEKVSRNEILKKQNESQILLLLCWADRKEKGWYPLKIFGYLASKRPILAIGGNGEDVIEKIIIETKSGVYCKNKNEIKDFLKKSYFEYKKDNKVSYSGNLNEINKHSYKEKAREFANILNRI